MCFTNQKLENHPILILLVGGVCEENNRAKKYIFVSKLRIL